jgi:hypothetical protein
MLRQSLNNVFTLFHYFLSKNIIYEFLKMSKDILYLYSYLKTYPNVKLIY